MCDGGGLATEEERLEPVECPFTDSFGDESGGRRVSWVATFSRGMRLPGEEVSCRNELVSVLARCLSTDCPESCVPKCELSRCITVRDDRLRGIGTFTEPGRGMPVGWRRSLGWDCSGNALGGFGISELTECDSSFFGDSTGFRLIAEPFCPMSWVE